MKRIYQVLVVLLAVLFIAACGAESDPENGAEVNAESNIDEENAGEDENAGETENTGEAENAGETENSQDEENTGNSEEEKEEEEKFAEDCSVILELSDGIILAETWPEPVPVDIRPLICWELPEGVAEASAENGWEVIVQREDKVAEDMDSKEWSIMGLNPALRQIHYGVCETPNQGCTEFIPLSEGRYFIHILEPFNDIGPAASLVVEFQ